MTTATVPMFSPREASDRNFFLLILAAIWGGVIAGFVPDSLDHFTGKHVGYAPIVHVHAISYVAWLALLTTQMSLVRAGNVPLHKRLGVLALVMIPWMTIIGPWTFLVMGNLEFGTPDGDAPFLIVPIMSVVAFAPLAFTGLALRADSAVHKRLMLIATLVLSDAGFGRWIGPFLGPFLGKMFGRGFLSFYLPHFICSDILMAAILTHDVATRRRVHPVVVAAIGFAVIIQALTTYIDGLPAWRPIATHILGH
jgi:hypothetical protein